MPVLRFTLFPPPQRLKVGILSGRGRGCRLSAFMDEEKVFLMPLPSTPYETAVWSSETIQPDYLVTVGSCRYSVPYEYIGRKVDVRATEKCVEIFYHNQRIASHVRVTYSPDPIYIPEHMPEAHRRYRNYNEDSFQQWAEDIGTSTAMVASIFLHMHKTPQQGYKSCASMMKLADRFTPARLEAACAKALSYTPSPSLKNISTILKNGQDKIKAGTTTTYQRQSWPDAPCSPLEGRCTGMTVQSTIDKLREMRLSAMAGAFETQCGNNAFSDLSFEDRFGMLVDKEWDLRKNNKLSRLIRSAGFRYPGACMEDIEYHADRKLDRSELLRLSRCGYIHDNHHIIIEGASGSGKTYLSNALGVAACRNYLTVRYVRIPDLLNELAVARGEGT